MAVLSIPVAAFVLLEFVKLDACLLDLWMEALISRNKSSSQASRVKLSFSRVERDSVDPVISSSIPGNEGFSLLSAPVIMLDSSSGSSTPKRSRKRKFYSDPKKWFFNQN